MLRTSYMEAPRMDIESEFRQSHMKHPPPLNLIDYRDIHRDDFEFDIGGKSVMVFLHIQKTGGSTFSKHLVKDVDLQDRCLSVAFFNQNCTDFCTKLYRLVHWGSQLVEI